MTFATFAVALSPLDMPDNDILDLPSPKKQGLWLMRLFYTALAFFLYYVLADFLEWPLGSWALVAGLLCFGAVSVLRFRKNRKEGVYQLFYLAGHLTLLSGIGLYMLNWSQATPLFWIAFGAFAIGLMMISIKK